ncbi:helix-turn-helix transcriptional regulator [Fortiea contorta]|uniref:helix-turn-helix transcriptional regulator n=1 Tax=Fortiea contorta TaxID=1892405 RepID=UPI00034B82E8|nr:helix-turn-helix transcriptional regulator [Fortiea contorta]
MTDTTPYKPVDNISKALRLMRVFYDLTQKDLALKLGISKSHLSEIESANKTPTLDILKGYSEIFEVSMSSIIFFAENVDSNVDLDLTTEFVDTKIIAMLKFIKLRNLSRNNHISSET